MNGEFIGIMGSSGSGKTTFLKLYTKRDAESGDVTLAVRDNGIGVKPWDLPFIFEIGRASCRERV